MRYHLVLSVKGVYPNCLLAMSSTGHTIQIVFESHRWMDAIYAVVANATERIISWLEAAKLNRIIRMFFDDVSNV